MERNARNIFALVLAATILATAVPLVLADNTNPLFPTTLTAVQSERLNESRYGSKQVDAMAGNITEITLVGKSASKNWQGYYGNISGTISLEDLTGNIFYDWSDVEPQGEIYASYNSSVTWANIRCWNSSGTGGTNLTYEEAFFGITSNAVYGIDETFNETTHPEIVVGTYNITTNTCNTTYTYVNSARQRERFVEVLLSDGAAMVFTTIIENRDIISQVENTTDLAGFDNNKHDFQMLVGENGQNGDDQVTPYYFWVELS